MTIKVLGACCRNCTSLDENVNKAVEELGKPIELIKITEIEDMMKYDIIATPALVIDEKVVSSGKALKVKEVKKLIEKYS